MNDFIELGLWAAGIGAVFAFLWWKGYLLRISNYFAETRDELRKCSWPSKPELKGSTVVVLVAVALLAVFTTIVDFVLSQLLKLVT